MDDEVNSLISNHSPLNDMSLSIGQLAAALAAAQGKITGALKDSSNPFFKSKYADLASCWEACRIPLSENGLAVIQTTAESADGVIVLTTLVHKSGEWIRGTLMMKPIKADPQGVGSCITYARRYALAAIVGLAQIDDDANAASSKGEDIIQGHDLNKQWSGVDTRRKNKYVEQFVGYIGEPGGKDPDDLGVRQLWEEIKADHDMARAVWATLNKYQHHVILTLMHPEGETGRAK